MPLTDITDYLKTQLDLTKLMKDEQMVHFLTEYLDAQILQKR